MDLVNQDDNMNDIRMSVNKVRTLVKYVRSSPARLQKFKSCVEEEQIESNRLVHLDVDSRLTSTFLMLESALKFKKAFFNLLSKDSKCEKEIRKCEGGLINESDWVKVEVLIGTWLSNSHILNDCFSNVGCSNLG